MISRLMKGLETSLKLVGEGNHYVSYNTTGNNAIMSHPSVNGNSKTTCFFFFLSITLISISSLESVKKVSIC